MRYKLNTSWETGQPCSIQQYNDDGSQLSIPLCIANMDFQRFIAWNATNGHPFTLPSELQVDEAMAIRMHEPIPTATADLTDDTPRPPSDDMLAKIQFCAEYTTADICDVMQAYMAGDTKPLEALLTRRQEISATVQAETQAKLDAAAQIKVQG